MLNKECELLESEVSLALTTGQGVATHHRGVWGGELNLTNLDTIVGENCCPMSIVYKERFFIKIAPKILDEILDNFFLESNVSK